MNFKDTLPRFGFQGLLICLVILFALMPMTHFGDWSEILIRTSFTLVLLASVYMVSNKLEQALIAVVLAVPALLGYWVSFFQDVIGHYFIHFSFSILLQTYVTFRMINHVFRAKTIDRSILYGAVCIYLMIGHIFATSFAMLEALQPGSFEGLQGYITLVGNADAQDIIRQYLFYYSFVTLTTLGYGQIAPATVLSNSLSCAEALIGQFYMTILVARLVAIYVATTEKKESL